MGKEPISEVFNMDCVAYMKTLPDGYFSLTIADPNYGIGISKNPFRQKFKKLDWDTTTPQPEFFDELFRVSKNQIIWGGNYFGLPPNKHFIIWDKVQPFDFSSSMCEYAWSSFDKPAKLFRKRVVEDKGKIHPTQKPIDLYAWIIRNYANEGDIIFDPMMGSQSSRIAAYKLGIDYIGCEIDADYYASGCARFERECNGVYADAHGHVFVQQQLF